MEDQTACVFLLLKSLLVSFWLHFMASPLLSYSGQVKWKENQHSLLYESLNQNTANNNTQITDHFVYHSGGRDSPNPNPAWLLHFMSLSYLMCYLMINAFNNYDPVWPSASWWVLWWMLGEAPCEAAGTTASGSSSRLGPAPRPRASRVVWSNRRNWPRLLHWWKGRGSPAASSPWDRPVCSS